MGGCLPKVDKSAFSKEDDVTSRFHGESVDLGLDVDGLLGVGLQPGNVDLNVEVTDAEVTSKTQFTNFV